jgi:hypothetical protein
LTDFLKTGTLVLSVSSLILIVAAVFCAGVALFEHLSKMSNPKSLYHVTEMTKIIILLSCAVTLATTLCGIWFLISSAADAVQSICASLHALTNCHQ